MLRVSAVSPEASAGVRLRELMECIQEIQQFTDGMSKETFLKDKLAYLATLKNLQIIGDCVKSIPRDQRKRFDVPWQCIVSLGRKIIRSRNDIDGRVLWNMIQKELPPLKCAIEALMSECEVAGNGESSVSVGAQGAVDSPVDQPA